MVQIIKHSSKLSRRNLFIYLLNKDGKVAHIWEAEGGWEGGKGAGGGVEGRDLNNSYDQKR